MPPLGRAAIAALLTAAIATFAAVVSGPVDPPSERGLHGRNTPSSGGVAILLGTAVGALLLASGPGLNGGPQLAAALALSTLMGVLGAADDLWDLGPRFKLMAQVVLALAFCTLFARVEAIGGLNVGPVVGALGSALWIIVAVNAVNFMDGADGLAPGAMVIALTSLGFACRMGGATAVGDLSLVAAAAGLGFLPWNLPAGRIFQGDAGALFTGTLFASLTLIAAGPTGEAQVSVWFAPVALLPLLTDVFLTLIDRARRRQPLLKAHREHLFQRWLVARQASHRALSVRVWMMVAASSGLALGLTALPEPWRPALFESSVALSVGLWIWIDRRIRR